MVRCSTVQAFSSPQCLLCGAGATLVGWGLQQVGGRPITAPRPAASNCFFTRGGVIGCWPFSSSATREIFMRYVALFLMGVVTGMAFLSAIQDAPWKSRGICPKYTADGEPLFFAHYSPELGKDWLVCRSVARERYWPIADQPTPMYLGNPKDIKISDPNWHIFVSTVRVVPR